MKLSKNEQLVLEYLKQPRSSQEVADYLGHKLPPYGILRLLQRLDLVDRVANHRKNAPSVFIASGRPMLQHPNITYKDRPMVMGVRL